MISDYILPFKLYVMIEVGVHRLFLGWLCKSAFGERSLRSVSRLTLGFGSHILSIASLDCSLFQSFVDEFMDMI